MATSEINPDLLKERQRATFNVNELTHLLYGGPEQVERKRYIQNAAIQNMDKHNFPPISTLSHEEQYAQALHRNNVAAPLFDQLGLTDKKEIYYFREACFPRTPLPYSLHWSMFTNQLETQTTEEQKAQWLPLAKSYRIIGTYAQTELGHGTFLRGLETIATYDAKTQEFIINSPTITATKYWPGGLGKTANCCIVMAQLIINGKKYGMHSFLVQIRDLDTHEPLPGITVGDIGTKFGFNSNDNGFLHFNNVRIPRQNMLMRYSKVLEDGKFVKPENDRLVYGTMTLVRSDLVYEAARSISLSVTIAVRYSAVRRQSEIEPGSGEVQVLDFQTQQNKLIPQIATAYALTFASRSMTDFYMHVSKQINDGLLDELPQLHALSAGLKAVSGHLATTGTEVCRLACGGHGYSQASGIPKIYTNSAPLVTYEGENTVMLLQTARYLAKCCQNMRQGHSLPSLMRYLQFPLESSSSGLDFRLVLDDLVDAFHHRAARMVLAVVHKLEAATAKGMKSSDAWNINSVQLVCAAVAHTEAYIVKTFVEAVKSLNGKLKTVMEAVCRLHAVNRILSSLGDFMLDSYISPEQATMLKASQLEHLALLRPDAVALVDAFDFPDAVLDSALGRWDGQVYQALYDFSLNSKLNEKQVLDAYYKYQRPFMESQWQKNPSVAAVSRL